MITLSLIVLLSSATFAASMSSSSNRVPTNAITGGGTHETSTKYMLYESIIQSTPAGSSESSSFRMGMGHMYTLIGITTPPGPVGAPTIEVIINGKKFVTGDIVPPNKDNIINLVVHTATWISTCEAFVDGSKITIALLGYTPQQSTYIGTFLIIPHPWLQTHTLTFFASDEAGNSDIVTMETKVLAGGIQVVGVPLNYPNPFKPLSGGSDSKTIIQYILSDEAPITIIMYDITGQEIRKWGIPSGTPGARAGVNQIEWDGRSIFGEVVGNGMYVYKIISGDKAIGTGKLVVMD